MSVCRSLLRALLRVYRALCICMCKYVNRSHDVLASHAGGRQTAGSEWASNKRADGRAIRDAPEQNRHGTQVRHC